MPHIGQVMGPAPGYDEQGIDAHDIAAAQVAWGELLGGGGHPFQPMAIERDSHSVATRSRLDFDEGEGASAPGDDINLAAPGAGPARENPPAVQAQIPAGDGLGAATAPFGGQVISRSVHFDLSSARA